MRSSSWRCGASFPCFTVLRFDGHGALGREVQGGMCVRLCVVWKLSSAVAVVGVVRLCGARPPQLPSCDSETGQALAGVWRVRACVPRSRSWIARARAAHRRSLRRLAAVGCHGAAVGADVRRMSGSPAVPGRCTDVLVFVSPIVYIETVGFTKRSKRLRFGHK